LIALGLIETVGYATAVSAADAAVKAADVEIIGLEKIIGVNGYVSVTVHFSGDVAAVQSAVDAGREKGEMIGEVVSSEVIARAHSDVQESLISQFKINDVTKGPEEVESKKIAAEKKETEKKETKKAASNKKSAKDKSDK